MTRPSHTRLLAALSWLALSILYGTPYANAAEERVWVASGKPGGTYRDVYAQRLADALTGKLVLHRTTSGSVANLDLLVAERVDLAFVQADIYAAALARDPQRYGALVMLGRVADECVFVAIRKDGRIRVPEDLERVDGGPAEVALGPREGGMSGTWEYMAALEPGLRNARVHYVAASVAIGRLESGTFDAVAWVTDPENLGHQMLRGLRERSGLQLLEITDADLTGTLPDGSRVYEARSIRVTADPEPRQIRTICTSALLLTRSDTRADVVEAAVAALGLQPPSQAPAPTPEP